MQITDLPAERMLPRVLLARRYDSELMQYQEARRCSESYELSYYTADSGSVCIGGVTYPLHEGDVRFVCPGTVLSSVPRFCCCTVYFDLGEPGRVLRNQILDGIPVCSHPAGELRPLFESIVDAYESAQLSALVRLNGLLLTLLAALFEDAHSSRHYSPAVRLCIGHMQQHFAEPITLDTLGALSGYSKLHLLRLFEQDTGQTPHKWLRSIRLGHAKHLLAQTDLTLDDIAAACGFASVSHFKTLFHRQTRFTPGAYRRYAREG